ncbi:response regulator [Candidatus Woesearchaeota archaeon]|nr:response regulator [Candidatus Woesearchaeota archaeon]
MKTILAVDDYPDILGIYKNFLSKVYNVLSADTPFRALKMIEERPVGSIDLLLTDLNMPKMKGPELIREVYRLRPEIKFVLASNADQSDIQPYLEQLKAGGVPDVAFFEKGKSRDELVRLIESLVGR